MQPESIEFGFLSIFSLITFFVFLILSKYAYKFKNGILLDNDFNKNLNHFIKSQLVVLEA